MNILAIIPARAGSKGVPNKNIRLLGQHPLVYYSIKNALQSKYITDVIISTDSNPVRIIAQQMGRLTAGIEMVLDAIAFDSLLEGASLVITGEGRIDAQTAAGKTAAGVLRHAARKGIPVIAIGGSVAMCRELKEMGFIGIYSIINAPVSLEQAMRQDWATARIRCTVEQILTTMKHCTGTLLFQKGGD